MPDDNIVYLSGSLYSKHVRVAGQSPKHQEEHEYLQLLAELAERLTARLENDFSVIPPRAGDYEGKAVSHWFTEYQNRFIELLTELIAEAAGEVTEEQRQHKLENARDVAQRVLPQLMPELRAFALRQTALRWGASKYPNFVVFGRPEYSGGEPPWVVPLEHAPTHRRVGQVTLDSEGNIHADKTSTRQEVREALLVAA